MTSGIDRPPLRVGLAQFKPLKGEVPDNLRRIREWAAGAGQEHDLLVFPEAALTGYFLQGGVAEASLTAEQLAQELGEPAGGAPDLVVGFFERRRHRLFNSAAWLTPDGDRFRVVHVHRKLFLPTYGIFDEARFVERGREVSAFDTRFGRMGMLVCEDAWHSLPGTLLALDGAEVVVIASASPARGFAPGSGRPGNLDRWDALASSIAVEHGVFVVVSQLVGSEGGKLFPGGSIAAGPDGAIMTRGPLFQEETVSVTLDGSELDRVRADTPLLSDLELALPHLARALVERVHGRSDGGARPGDHPSAPADMALHPSLADPGQGGSAGASGGGAGGRARPRPGDASVLELDLELVERTLTGFIHEEVVGRRGFERVVIGVSGGVDSAVSLFLAAKALGAENVFGFRLPYATSSQESLDHATLVLEATGVEGRTLDITGPVDAYVEQHEPDLSPRRRGNLAARFRAMTLFDQSARLHALPCGTGNKSERLLGYFTWHADDSPPINPLGDLFKTQVWALARHLGVPEVIVEKPASADLVKGVHDEDELGIGYPRADLILHWILRGYSRDQLERSGFDPGEVELVWRRLSSTHWKRELPTVAVLSETAIGEFYLRPVDF
ncbi:MAG: NAD(+) synthase [Gemmatimonadota bacterium]